MKNLYKFDLSKVLNTFDNLMNKYSYDEVILYSGEAKIVYLDDNKYPFKVYVNFKYFAPVLNHPHSFIIYKSGEKPKLILLQKIDFWDSQPQAIKGIWCDFFDISYYHNLEDMRKQLPRSLKNTAFLGEEITRFQDYGFKSLNNQKIINHIHYNRCFKSEYEVECMKKANQIASIAHKTAKEAFLSGKSELQTHLAYLEAITYKEVEVPCENIVAFDESCSILHYLNY